MSKSSTAVTISEEFRRVLKQCGLLGFFVECAYVHRAGYMHWITTPARRETRAQRIQQAATRLAVQRAEVLWSNGQTNTPGRRSA